MAQMIYMVLNDLSTPSFELKGISDTLLSLASLYLPLFRPFLLPGMPSLFCPPIQVLLVCQVQLMFSPPFPPTQIAFSEIVPGLREVMCIYYLTPDHFWALSLYCQVTIDFSFS